MRICINGREVKEVVTLELSEDSTPARTLTIAFAPVGGNIELSPDDSAEVLGDPTIVNVHMSLKGLIARIRQTSAKGGRK